MAATTTIYLYAKIGWPDEDKVSITGSTLAPFSNAEYKDEEWYLDPSTTTLISGTTTSTELDRRAFADADALFGYADAHSGGQEDHHKYFRGSTALFAAHVDSYGDLDDHNDFTLITVKVGDNPLVKFGHFKLWNEGEVDTFTFKRATVLFSGENSDFSHVFYMDKGSHCIVTDASNITVNGDVTLNSHAQLVVEAGSQITAGSIDVGWGGNISIEGSNFTASSFKMGSGGAKLSIKSDPVNGSPSNVTLGTIDFDYAQTNSIETDWKSTVTFNGITGQTAGKVIIDLTGIDTSAEQTNAILNYVGTGTVPDEAFYKNLLGTDAWNAATSYDPRNPDVPVTGFTVTASGGLAFSKLYGTVYVEDSGDDNDPSRPNPHFHTVARATAVIPTDIIVLDGNYDKDINVPVFNGFKTTIQNGTFATSVCGGKVFNAEGEVSGDINFSIAGGTFSKLVFAGDRVNGGVQQTRTGNLTTTITNGVFNSAVAGGMLVTVATTNAVLKGDVLLTIKGGNFSDWIYGGGLASKKSFGGATTIEGNVTVKLDSSESGSNGLKLSTTLVVGSYGAGHIGTEQDKKNTKLILTGGKDIELSGEIWGGCSSDIITTNTIPDKGNNRKVDSTVTGNRILSFTGFNGHLTTQKNRIRAFSDIELKGNSTVTLNNYGSGSVNLSDVVNWTFEYGSSLTGDFINDFNGDTLNLTGFSGTGTFNLMSYSDASNTNDIFNGFGQLNGVELNGAAGSYRNGAWEWDNASLAINNGIMQLTIA